MASLINADLSISWLHFLLHAYQYATEIPWKDSIPTYKHVAQMCFVSFLHLYNLSQGIISSFDKELLTRFGTEHVPGLHLFIWFVVITLLIGFTYMFWVVLCSEVRAVYTIVAFILQPVIFLISTISTVVCDILRPISTWLAKRSSTKLSAMSRATTAMSLWAQQATSRLLRWVSYWCDKLLSSITDLSWIQLPEADLIARATNYGIFTTIIRSGLSSLLFAVTLIRKLCLWTLTCLLYPWRKLFQLLSRIHSGSVWIVQYYINYLVEVRSILFPTGEIGLDIDEAIHRQRFSRITADDIYFIKRNLRRLGREWGMGYTSLMRRLEPLVRDELMDHPYLARLHQDHIPPAMMEGLMGIFVDSDLRWEMFFSELTYQALTPRGRRVRRVARQPKSWIRRLWLNLKSVVSSKFRRPWSNLKARLSKWFKNGIQSIILVCFLSWFFVYFLPRFIPWVFLEGFKLYAIYISPKGWIPPSQRGQHPW